VNNRCNSSFWELSGSQAALTFVCGDSDAELDAMCCAECRNNTLCEFWVRESGSSGAKQCWLRYNPGGFSKNLARRGGWKQGCAGTQGNLPVAKATFQDWSGPEVDKLGVCGDSDIQLNNACADLCENHKDCEFWVREHGTAQVNQKNSKFCWLRKISAATQSSNTARRGGRKPCKSGKEPACASTFDNMGGPAIQTNRTCGSTEAELDAGCCAKCNDNPDCQFWTREAGNAGGSMGYKYCWLHKNAAAYNSTHATRRGAFKRHEFPQCNAAFKDMDGTQVGVLKVYGNTDEEIDAMCCSKCSEMKTCDFWVREYHDPKRVPGGKHCWLRATKPGGQKRNSNNRRGGMKLAGLIQSDASVTGVSMLYGKSPAGILEEGEPPVDQKETFLVDDVSDDGAASIEEQLPGEVAHASEATKTVQVRKLDEAALKEMQEKQSKEKAAEQEALKRYFANKVNVEGATAVLDERGYQSIVKLKSNTEMEIFIRRTIADLNLRILNEGALAGMIPFYSGTQDHQSMEKLQLELEEVAYGGHRGAWLTAASF